MSRAEEITSEVRRLVLSCRAMEAQLQQSIPKKTHQDVVAKMQATIDGLNADVERVKGELQKTTSLNESISVLGRQIASQAETINSQVQTVNSHGQMVESQSKTIEGLAEKLSQHTVPVLLYNQTLSRVEELEEKIRCMVDKVDYVASQKKCEDLSEAIRSMVPREEYLALQAQFSNFVPRESFDELQRTLSQYVPREQLAASETRVHELEATLTNHVPREQLTASEARIRELETLLTSYVPREQLVGSETRNRELEARLVESYVPRELLTASETRISELEAKLASHVPRSDYEDLTAKIASLTKEAAATLGRLSSESLVEITEQNHYESKPEFVSQSVTSSKTVEATVSTQQLVEPITEGAVTLDEKRPESSKPEINEIQTQLSEMKGSVDSGETTMSPESNPVDSSLGFIFKNTSISARSGVEFLQNLEQTPAEIVEIHNKNGDFERWFKDVLSDDSSATSLKSIRESKCGGEELKSKIVAVIAPRYKS